ncbi:hypothetical protein AVEN_230825-1 [Araneus ventricosus]|uniref:Uncharacterized protein n=1 Tax=Araneus ventricosus TaxID=182803 RepID=A0A4Y2A391_ARAVE|nr:hypothetical protein AVEN_230825-1 [Araneus ventricosus]
MSDKCIRSVPAATMAGYEDLSDFERGVIIGAREMGHSISEVAMKFGFSRTIISRVYREYRVCDLNGYNTLWGYNDVDSRGTAIEEFILANNLFINNSSDAPPTFTRNTSKGWADLSLCTQQMIGNHLKIAQDILEKIFPHPANSNSSTYIPLCTSNDCPFIKGEVATVIHHLSKGKAPGPDGIDNSIFSRNSPSSSWNCLTLALNWLNFPIPLRFEISFFFINTANLKQKHLLTGPSLCSRQ